MIDLKTQNAELIEQINSLQAARGRMVDEHFEEKKELKEQLAKAKNQNQHLLNYLEDAHAHIGHLAAHLAGRIGDMARLEMARRADEWREYCEQLRKEQDGEQ